MKLTVPSFTPYLKATPLFSVAFLVNMVIFFSFPVMNHYFKGGVREEQGNAKKKEIVVNMINDKPKKEKKRKLKLERPKPSENKAPKSSSRFKLNLSAGGSGVGMASDNLQAMVFKAGEVDKEARPIQKPAPDFPAAASAVGISGYVELVIVINEAGEVVKAEVQAEDPEGFGFGEAAIQAAYRWRFRPAEKNNVPVKMEYILPFNFE